jgi:plasmid stabilization system protein ParE
MRHVLFHPIADGEQDEIYRWTAVRWGEPQADTYIRGLHNHLDQLAEIPSLWRPLEKRLTLTLNADHQIYVTRYRMHYVFFRKLSDNRLGVLRLIDVRRELPRKLQRELMRMTKDPL